MAEDLNDTFKISTFFIQTLGSDILKLFEGKQANGSDLNSAFCKSQVFHPSSQWDLCGLN